MSSHFFLYHLEEKVLKQSILHDLVVSEFFFASEKKSIFKY